MLQVTGIMPITQLTSLSCEDRPSLLGGGKKSGSSLCSGLPQVTNRKKKKKFYYNKFNQLTCSTHQPQFFRVSISLCFSELENEKKKNQALTLSKIPK